MRADRSTRGSRRTAGLVGLAAVAMLGCQAAAATGASCSRPSDCATPLVCTLGRCRAECRDGRDCPVGARCLASGRSAGDLGVCSFEDENHCDTRVCPAPLTCVADECRTGCADALECIARQCVAGSCVEPPNDGAPRDGGADAIVQSDAAPPADASIVDVGGASDASASDAGLDAGAPTRIFVLAGGASDGALGGRSGADARCAAAAALAPGSWTHVHALVAISASDDIASMPANFGMPPSVPFVGPAGTPVIAMNLADLLDGSIDVALADAGLSLVPSGRWFSGSDVGGHVHAGGNCDGFTLTSGRGAHGLASRTDGGWIEESTGGCGLVHETLCVAW